MKRIFFLIAAVIATLLLNGCLGGAFDLGSSAPAPTDVKVAAGDSSATLTWTMAPNVEYWVFTAPGTNTTTDNWNTLGGAAYPKAVSPHVVTGLTNGATYSFTINGRIDGGAGGPGSPSVSTVPRLAGATWTAGTPLGTNNMNGVTVGAVFVAVGAQGAMYSSPDFDSWTPVTWTALKNPMGSPLPDLNAAIYGGSYLAAGAGGTMLLSSDAITWTQQTCNTNGNDLYALATNGAGGYVAVGQNGTIVTSIGGTSWAMVSSGTLNDLYAVAYGNGTWVAVGKGGTLLTSTNGSTWLSVASHTAQNLKGITYGVTVNQTTAVTANVFMAVGAAGTLVSSTDYGVTWTATQINSGANNLAAVTYGREFVIVGNAGSIYTSLDGTNWTKQSSNTTSDLNAIAHSVTNYSVMGVAGTNLSAI